MKKFIIFILTAVCLVAFGFFGASCSSCTNGDNSGEKKETTVELSLEVGQSYSITTNYKYYELIFTSENPEIATVDRFGDIRALAEGSTRIIVGVGNQYIYYLLTVKPINAYGEENETGIYTVTLDKISQRILNGGIFELHASVTKGGKSVSDENVVWTVIQDENIISILPENNAVKVYANAIGKATVVATVLGYSASCAVTSYSEDIETLDFEVNVEQGERVWWENVENAESVDVSFDDGITWESYATSGEISDFGNEPQAYSMLVKAVGDGCYYETSEIKTVLFRNKMNLYFDGEKLTLIPLDTTQKYNLYDFSSLKSELGIATYTVQYYKQTERGSSNYEVIDEKTCFAARNDTVDITAQAMADVPDVCYLNTDKSILSGTNNGSLVLKAYYDYIPAKTAFDFESASDLSYVTSSQMANPAVIYDEEKQEFVMVYRAAGNDVRHEIKMGLATSKDGVHFERQSDSPVFFGTPLEADGGCVEDPRIVKLGDLYYMTYAARCYAPGQYWLEPWVEGVSKPPMYLDKSDVHGEELPVMAKKNITVTYLAVTKDFKRYKKLGRLTEPSVDDRDVLLFPEKINGKYVIISRPKFKDANVKMPSIWITFTDDLMEYQKPELLFTGKEWWETQRIGAGTPPIKTEYGWLMLYHGVDDKGIYRDGAVLLDLNDPRKILARTKDFIMEPDQPFEFEGFYEGCVFPTGAVVKDGTLYVYYGCADKYIGLATVNFKDFLDHLINECKV